MATGCSPHVGRHMAQLPTPVGCRCHSCSMRKWSSNQILAPLGWQINTAFVERLNLDIRQHVPAVGRRVNTLCKGEDGLRQQLALYHVYHDFFLPQAGVRQALPLPEPTHGTGSAKQWRPCTPAMAAGLTDHVWRLREVLLFRVPPWPQLAGV